jgi:hypothetical protein
VIFAFTWRSAEHETPMPDRTRRAVARQPHDAHVVREVLAAELRADPDLVAQLLYLLFEPAVAEHAAERIARGGQVVERVTARELDRLERVLGRRAADRDGEVIGRARRRADRADLLLEEAHQRLGVEQRLRLLEQERLVRRPAALRDEQQLVRVAGHRVDLHLRGQIGARVLLGVEIDRRHLRVAQVARLIGVEDAVREGARVVDARVDVLALVADHDRGAGVLAAGQLAARGDVCVGEQLERDEAVVVGGLGVVEDPPQLREMARAQQVRDVVERNRGELAQRLGVHLEHAPRTVLDDADLLRGQLESAVGGVVVAVLEQRLIDEFRHGDPPSGLANVP